MLVVIVVLTQAFLRPGEGKPAIGEREHERAETADGGGFSRRGQPEQDRA
jgi:hypothetical protein